MCSIQFRDPRFFDFVAYAQKRNVKVTTNTNLALLNPKRAEACVTSELDEMAISIDGARTEAYESIRVRGHFDRCLKGVTASQVVKAAVEIFREVDDG